MLRCAAVFSNNMVLQREKNIEIWGETDASTVRASIPERGVVAEAFVENGKWKAILPPQSAGTGLTLTVSAGDEVITFTNVAVGEVWLLGGQSNMELEIRNAKDGKELLKTLTPECNVRFYYTPKQTMIDSDLLEAEKHTGWQEAGEEASQAWSAVGLHFGLKLARELGVTVGLIGCNWGGTSASCWCDRETLVEDKDTGTYIDEYDEATKGKTEAELLKAYSEFIEYDRQWNERAAKVYAREPKIGWEELQAEIGKNAWPGPMSPKNPMRPCGLFEAMLMRVCPYTLRGFTYYQGESDEHKPGTYYKLLCKLIGLWRKCWGDEQLPFIIVQLPMFKYLHEEDNGRWAIIREAQERAFKTVRNTGLTVILDKGELDNIHPTDKKPVGERMALQAEKLFYGKEVSAFGPMYKSCIYKDGGMELCFDYSEGGFDIAGEISGFEIAGCDKRFFPADAQVQGERIFLSAKNVSAPMYARYNFVNYGEVTVFGKNGIPLAPFRTSLCDAE